MQNKLSSTISRRHLLMGAACAACPFPAFTQTASSVSDIVGLLRSTYGPVAAEHDVPGLVVAVAVRGQRYFFEHGVTARQGGGAATRDTIFEIGSVSKCFTATLAAHAAVRGRLALDMPAEQLVPQLSDTALGGATLLYLITYTAGGLPLQFPDEVKSVADAMSYYRAFVPVAAAGTVRQYSNPSIGLAGHATARALNTPFVTACEGQLFSRLGLQRTFIQVPPPHTAHYAWGHDKAQRHIRVNPGVFDAEAYGVKSTAADMLTFLEANLHPARTVDDLRQAIESTQIGRVQVGPMVQGLGWEQYPWPVEPDTLLAGNGPKMIFDANAAMPYQPTPVVGRATLFNKTGSTGGFGAYAAFVPQRQVALVMLANRNFPIPARVNAAHQVLRALA